MNGNVDAIVKSTARKLLEIWYLEIEGLPYVYGTAEKVGSSWFTAHTNPPLGMRPFLLGIPKVVGQTIDTLAGGNTTAGSSTFDILDKNGELTALVNISTPPLYSLTAAVAKADTTIQLNTIAGLSAGDYLYVGTETIKVGAVTTTPTPRATGCTRGYFGSTAQAFPYQFPVDIKPWVMANRQVKFWQAVADGGATFPAPTDANSVLRFQGTLKQFILKDGDRNTFSLTAESVDRELDREVFRVFRSFPLRGSSIKDKDGNNGNTQVMGFPGAWPGYDEIANFDITGPAGNIYTNGEVMLARIDKEVFALQFDLTSTSNPKAKMVARGLFDTAMTDHQEGAIVQEIVPVVAQTTVSANGAPNDWPGKASKFNVSPQLVPSDHPISILLQLLMSTGTGTNYSGINYDTLPEGWGLGMPVSRIDVAGITRAALEDPTLRFGGVVEQPQNFTKLLREFLTFAGYYFCVTTDNLFTIRRLRPPLPDVTTRTVTKSNIIRGRAPTWEANWRGAVREVVFQFGWDITDSKFKKIVIFKLNDADIYSKGMARSVKLESRFIYPGGSGIPGSGSFRPYDVDTWLLNRADFFRLRYGKPPPIIRVAVDYSFLGTELGELVALTEDYTPNHAGGTRGLTAAIGEVINKDVDDQTHTIVLTLLMTGYNLGAYRYISPSFLLKAGEFTIETDTYQYLYITNIDSYATFINGDLGNDGHVTTPGGSTHYFGAYGTYRVWSEDWKDSLVGDVVDGDGNFLTLDFGYGGLSPPVPTWMTAGAVVTLDITSGAAQTWAFLADVLNLNGGTPHKLFPT